MIEAAFGLGGRTGCSPSVHFGFPEAKKAEMSGPLSTGTSNPASRRPARPIPTDHLQPVRPSRPYIGKEGRDERTTCNWSVKDGFPQSNEAESDGPLATGPPNPASHSPARPYLTDHFTTHPSFSASQQLTKRRELPPGQYRKGVRKLVPWWRCGESNSGPKQSPGRCLQAQSPRRIRMRHAW